MKFRNIVRITKTIPGSKHAIDQEIDLLPSGAPSMALRKRTAT